MTERRQYAETIDRLLGEQLSGQGLPLDAFLARHSNLPGPAANFTLLWALTDGLLRVFENRRSEVWGLLEGWARVPLEDAPANDPREFMPFAAAYACGHIGARWPEYWRMSLDRLRGQARDQRWRTREMVAQGLQSMLRADFSSVFVNLEAWVAGGDLLEMRAAVAALAEPDLMAAEGQARCALRLHLDVLGRVVAVRSEARRSEEFRALRKGLGYTVSVVVAGLPAAGWALLKEQAAVSDPDVRWIVRENLKKKRLAEPFPSEVAATQRIIERATSG